MNKASIVVKKRQSWNVIDGHIYIRCMNSLPLSISYFKNYAEFASQKIITHIQIYIYSFHDACM